jgi:ABC-type antimicrobial peptide transport system permease subunit
MDLVSGFIFYIILIVVVAFSILMAIFERTREFGVLMALGTTPGRLTRLLLFESCSMTLLGVVFGSLIGGLITWYFQAHGIVIHGAAELTRHYGLPERMYPQLSTLSVCTGAGVVLAVTLLTALYPALKIRRLRPVQAMAAI